VSEYLSKKAVLKWLESEMSINKGHPDDIDIHWTLNRVSKKIQSGAFDPKDDLDEIIRKNHSLAVKMKVCTLELEDEIQRLRAALERIKKWAEDPELGTMYKIWNLANETLKGDENDA